MSLAAWLPLIIKALATAVTVVSASLTAERLGPLWGAVVACLPVSAGPAYVFLALDHGPDFIAAGALASAAANAATGLFLICYGLLAARRSASFSLVAAIGVWLTASLALLGRDWTAASVLLLNVAIYGPGVLLLRPPGGGAAAAPPRRRWLDMPLRAGAVALFVSVLVTVSNLLGPAATGIAAVFPVSLISLLVIMRPRLGGPASARLALSALRPMVGFGIMLMVLHLAARPLGSAIALGLALAVSVLWSIGLLVPAVRRGRAAAGAARP